MKPPHSSLILTAVLVLFAGLASAEKADRNKPINVVAGTLHYDLQKQIMVYAGGVVVTKGSILIRGARIDLRQDPQGNQFGLVTAEPGKLAFFRQKREGLGEFVEGEAESIEYDGRADSVKFINNAQLRRYRGTTLGDEFTGHVIFYNNTSEVFSIDGTPAKAGAGAPAGRIRAMLTPKPEAAASAPAAAATPLRATTTLGEEKK